MDELFIQKGLDYAARMGLQVAERLGSGVHGIILVAVDKRNGGKAAIKVHREREAFLRECAVYERLADARVASVEGFHVPQIIEADDNLQIIRMTIVRRPFLLDFAGAYLDSPPEFSDEVIAEWHAEKEEQFGNRWPTVQSVLYELRQLGIHMVDVSPSNIAFAP
jgi:hypothetical protein